MSAGLDTVEILKALASSRKGEEKKGSAKETSGIKTT